MYKKMMKYFERHATYNAFIHALAGVGAGIILARPIDAAHPVRLGIVLIAVAILGHLVPLWTKK